VIDASLRGADGVKLADVNRDGLADIATGWEESGVTRVYLHPGHIAVRDLWPVVTVGQTPNVEDAVFADLDGDGTQEVVSSCEGETKTMFVHRAPTEPAHLLEADEWHSTPIPATVNRMQWMFAWPADVDGRNGTDIVAGGKNEVAAIGWLAAPPNPWQLDGWTWHEISPAGWVMSIWPRDVDGDGDLDVILSDRYGPLRGCRWLENPGRTSAATQTWTNRFIGGAGREVLSMGLADLDGDRLEDGIVAARERSLLVFRRLDASGQRWQEQEIVLDALDVGTIRAVAVGRMNGDDRPDIVVTSDAAASKHSVYWLDMQNPFTDATWQAHAISGRDHGVKYDRIELIDLDGDGDLDVLTCEESAGGTGLGVIWFENPTDEAFVQQPVK
jgi:hypothetical protein